MDIGHYILNQSICGRVSNARNEYTTHTSLDEPKESTRACYTRISNIWQFTFGTVIDIPLILCGLYTHTGHRPYIHCCCQCAGRNWAAVFKMYSARSVELFFFLSESSSWSSERPVRAYIAVYCSVLYVIVEKSGALVHVLCLPTLRWLLPLSLSLCLTVRVRFVIRQAADAFLTHKTHAPLGI